MADLGKWIFATPLRTHSKVVYKHQKRTGRFTVVHVYIMYATLIVCSSDQGMILATGSFRGGGYVTNGASVWPTQTMTIRLSAKRTQSSVNSDGVQ